MVSRFRSSKNPLRILLSIGVIGLCLGQTFGNETSEEVIIAAVQGIPPAAIPAARVELNGQAKDEDIRISGYLPDPLIPVFSKNGGEVENAWIVATLNAFKDRTLSYDCSALQEFVVTHPDSRWVPSVLLNLGILKYRNGYFSEALDFWKQCWEHSKDARDINGKLIADRAVAELASMLARIGRESELEKLLGEVKGRPMNISSEQRLNRARDGLWHMKNKPGAAFMCGPYALKAVGQCRRGWNKAKSNELLKGVQSTNKGFSVQELAELGNRRGVPVTAMRRAPGAPIVVPSVVHWKVGHFGAIVSRHGDSYYVVDPTFQNNTWMSEDAISREASGVFLISSNISAPKGWSGVPKSELAATFGKGHSGSTDEDETSDCSDKTGGDCGGGGDGNVGEQAGEPGGGAANIGMPTYDFHAMLCSLTVGDLPLPSVPTAGPSLIFKVTYNQREAKQPTTFTFSNFGPQWVCSLVSYLEEVNPGQYGTNVNLRLPDGGGEVYTYNSATDEYDRQIKTLTALTPIFAGNVLTGYKREYPTGEAEYYTHKAGAYYFLKERRDRSGNAQTFVYEDELTPGGLAGRLKRVYTCENIYAEVLYGNAAKPYLITKIIDPWGRSASFEYFPTGQLQSITDAAGLSSSFLYDGTGFLYQLSTPYGNTTFNTGHPGDPNDYSTYYQLIAWIEATDPMGGTRRLEMNLNSSETGIYSSPYQIPANIDTTTGDWDDRNTFYWNWKQWEAAKNLSGFAKYGKAHIRHWLQPTTGQDMSSGVKEWEKRPLESRVWYNYPGQQAYGSYNEGTMAMPTKIARLLDDNSTQLVQYQYNYQGKVTDATDADNYQTHYDYFPNGIDLQYIKKLLGASWVTVAEFGGYQSNGRPLWSKDAGGFTTNYTYSGNLLQTVTNPLQEKTTYVYGSTPGTLDYRQLVEVRKKPASGLEVTVETIHREIVSVGGRLVQRETTTDADQLVVVTDYDELLRPLKSTYGDGSYAQTLYNRLDPFKVRDRNGRWTTYLQNARQQTTDVFDPEGGHTKYEYCVCGALLALVDAEGHRTEWEYDLQLRPIWKKYADATKLDYTYEQTTSRLHTVTDAKGQVKTYDYDKRNHLTQITYTNALKPTPNVTFHYDALGRQDYRIDGTGQTNFTFYPLASGQLGAGRLQTSEGPGSNDTITFAYDTAGKVVGETADGATETVGIDYLGRLTSRDNSLGHQGLFYVGNGRRPDYVDYPNGLKAVYGYYPASKNLRLNTLLHRRPDLTQISKFTYDYDSMGNITNWKQERTAAAQGWQWVYRYDRIDQLKLVGATGLGTGFSARNEYYSYDKAGNRLSRQIDATVRKETPNALNQLLTLGGGGKLSIHGTVSEPAIVKVGGRDATMLTATEFASAIDAVAGNNAFTVSARDAAGNTTIKGYQVSVAASSGTTMLYDLDGNLSTDGTRTYDWDAENRLVGISYGNGTSTEMQYDGLGRRVKILEKQGASILTTKSLLWSGALLREERLTVTSPASTSVKRFYADGVQIDGQNYCYTKDHLGSIREIVDASRTVRARYEYDSWGKATKVEGDLSSDQLYTGHYLHALSGLYLTWYRAYNSDTARWLSRDPLENAEMQQGSNLYAYVRNNPLKWIDQLGLEQFEWNWGDLFAAMGVGAGSKCISGGAPKPGAGAVAGGWAYSMNQMYKFYCKPRSWEGKGPNDDWDKDGKPNSIDDDDDNDGYPDNSDNHRFDNTK